MFIFVYTIYTTIRFKKSLIIILAFCVLLNFGLNYFLIPSHGIIGAAWSSSICYAILFALSYLDLFILKRNNFLKKESENEL
jgi:O-antigen/teichoic acid export membrane protein